jgi:hypothetical protein
VKPQIDVKVGSVGRLVKAARTVVLGTAVVAAWSAAGQSNVPGNADRIQQREARLRELDQFNLDTPMKWCRRDRDCTWIMVRFSRLVICRWMTTGTKITFCGNLN